MSCIQFSIVLLQKEFIPTMATVQIIQDGKVLVITYTEQSSLNSFTSSKKKQQPALQLTPDLSCVTSYYLEPKQANIPLTVHLQVSLSGGAATANCKIKAFFGGLCQEMVMATEAKDTWTASWSNIPSYCCGYQYANCGSCGVQGVKPAVFQVLLDIGATTEFSFMRPGQKNVLLHMKELLTDPSLADVTFKFPLGKLQFKSAGFVFRHTCFHFILLQMPN